MTGGALPFLRNKSEQYGIGLMSYQLTWTAEDAFRRYEEVRDRLPSAAFPDASQACGGLDELADRFDAFLLDSFGVLNVGETAVPGAVACLEMLAAMGKRLIVLTNAASYPLGTALARYDRLGFEIRREDVVSSRDVCARRLAHILKAGTWGAIAASEDRFEDLDADVQHWTPQTEDCFDGFLFLSSSGIDASGMVALEEALRRRPRPLVIANPDLVAPRESGLSKEPGYYAHLLADRLGTGPGFFGKPYANAFEDALALLPGVPRERIAMVGDTLHTDILGGCAAGLKTVLVTDHGLFAGLPFENFVTASGIVPDFVCPAI